MAVLCTYVENKVILEHTLFYRASECKQTKEKGRAAKTVCGPIFLPFYVIIISFFFFFLPKCKYNRINLSYHRLQFVKETQINTVSNIEQKVNTVWKVSNTAWVISGPYFPVFRLNTEIYSVNLRIQSEYRKIRTRKKSVFEHFSSSGNVLFTTYIVFRASNSEMWETAFLKIFEKFPKHLSLWNTKEGLLLYICRIRNYWQQNYLE